MDDLQGQELGVVGNWWQNMMKSVYESNAADPNYFATNPETLESEAQLDSFHVGNGEDLYSHMTTAIEKAREEVVLITCFWARSTSQEKLAASLKRLSDRVVSNGESKVRIFIGFSSLSALQKLFHTRSLHGESYPPSSWHGKLLLPDPADLLGLDIQIKSIFVVPFSVMHPKFTIIDRKLLFLPSCNVSWESWFEGMIVLSGAIVGQFVRFWHEYWIRTGSEIELDTTFSDQSSNASMMAFNLDREPLWGAAHDGIALNHITKCYSQFLPSPHHVNPRFSFPWQEAGPPPPTPLNIFLLELIGSATSSVYIQTPNLTSPPVLKLILRSLRLGVNFHIITSERLMILEQLVTAGTTTSRCVKKLTKLYKRSRASPRWSDEEMGEVPVGNLKIQYYRPQNGGSSAEPVQSHLKLTIVDDEWIVFGSGNMDRASWYTSQELGVALRSGGLVSEVRKVVDRQMTGRTMVAFDSTFC